MMGLGNPGHQGSPLGTWSKRILIASEFEARHHGTVRAVLFGVALVAYQIDREDIVWRFLHWHSPAMRGLAQTIFALSLLIAVFGVSVQTWARAYSDTDRNLFLLGEILFTVGLGFYLSISGAILAIAGTVLLNLRLARRRRLQAGLTSTHQDFSIPKWSRAFRAEAAHWGFVVMMIVFTITLRDALAWSLAALAFLAGLILNFEGAGRRKRILSSLAFLAFLDSYARAQDHRTQKGSEVYRVRCANCHSTGQPSGIAPSLHHILGPGRLTEAEVREIVKNGKQTMPPLGEKLSALDLDALMCYLKTL